MELTESDRARWSKKVRQTDGCWAWTAGKNKRGYGLFNVGGASWLAHRLAYVMAGGALTPGQEVRHVCPGQHTRETRACVRPDHLALGTAKDNSDDKKAHGNSNVNVGADNGRAKLTEAQVLEIVASPESQRTIGARLGVSQAMISEIRCGNSWSHLTGIKPTRQPYPPRPTRRSLTDPISEEEAARFDEKVNKTETCWLWTAATDDSGYGVFSFRNRRVGAHRFACYRARGTYDPDLDVAHECGNALCVRPEHLIPRTRSQNMQNEETKTRARESRLGNRCRSLLSLEEEAAFGPRLIAGETAAALARERGVKPAVMERLRRRVLSNNLVETPSPCRAG